MRRAIRQMTRAAIFGGSILASGTVAAASAEVQTVVNKTMISGQYFGLCTIQLAEQAPGLDCPSKWVSASCSGDYNPSNVGWRKFEMAQMAQMLEKELRVRVDDARKHNGQCYASSVRLISQ